MSNDVRIAPDHHIELTASNGARYRRIHGVENVPQIVRMNHTTHCFKAYEVNPMIGCDHGCTYCSILASTEDDRFGENIVFADFPTHLDNFIRRHEDARSLTFFFTPQADAFSPVMLESGLTNAILSVFDQYKSRFFLFTKGGHGGSLPADIWRLLERASTRCQIVMSMGLPDSNLEARLEPGAASSADRLELLRKCRAAGIRASGSVAPFLPVYDNSKDYARRLFGKYRAVGVEHVSIELLKVTRAGLVRLLKAMPEHSEKLREVFDYKHKMEVEWRIPGGETVERFFTNREYLASQLRLACEAAAELQMSMSVCAEVAILAGMPSINREAARHGYSCAGVHLSLIAKPSLCRGLNEAT